jgi:hypothetical protein
VRGGAAAAGVDWSDPDPTSKSNDVHRAVLLLGGLREKDKLKDSGLKMELFHLEAGILHLRGRKIIRTLICSIVTGDAQIFWWYHL